MAGTDLAKTFEATFLISELKGCRIEFPQLICLVLIV